MSKYQFSQACRFDRKVPVHSITNFFSLTSTTFGISKWVTQFGHLKGMTNNDIDELVRRTETCTEDRDTGLFIDFVSGDPTKRVWVKIHTGSTEAVLNWYDVDFGQSIIRPCLSYFQQAVRIIRPFEAFILEDANEIGWNTSERQLNDPDGTRPAIIRWWHYLDRDMVESLGGTKHVLATPAFSTERFLDGVLIQLTKEWLDPSNPDHLKIQRRAMEHLGLIEWQPKIVG